MSDFVDLQTLTLFVMLACTLLPEVRDEVLSYIICTRLCQVRCIGDNGVCTGCRSLCGCSE